MLNVSTITVNVRVKTSNVTKKQLPVF